jgi:glycine cleavage system H protein
MTTIPDDPHYTSGHLWARRNGHPDGIRAGLTDFAQESLGDIVDVTPPRVGEQLREGQACGDVESTKSVNDLVLPVAGTVVASEELDAALENLMSVARYRALVGLEP